MHRIALALLVVAIASACDAPWDGPAIPSGAKSIGHNGLSEFGPVAIGQGILASTHLFDLRRQVLESKTTRSFPDLPACQADTHLPDPCWMQIADGNDRLFLAVSTVATCYRTVKEAAAILGISEATVKTRMFYARKNLAGVVKNTARSSVQ